MPDIRFKDLDAAFRQFRKEPPSVFLIHGEEALVKTAFDAVIGFLLQGKDPIHNHDPIENDDIHEALKRMNTYSLFGEVKIVSLKDSGLFSSERDDAMYLKKAKDAFSGNHFSRASKFIAIFAGILGSSIEDLLVQERIQVSAKAREYMEDGTWFEEIVRYCLEKNISVTRAGDAADDLLQAVEKGFPETNHLIITVENVQKKARIYKSIQTGGWVIDCSVPKGNRKADRMVQEMVLQDRMSGLLAPSGKTMDRRAFLAVFNKTGFDIRSFTTCVEKLIDYVGDRKKITSDDAEKLLEKTRSDPIYELTNAVSDRKTEAALHYLKSLLNSGLYPLQVLAALVNLFRRLLVTKSFQISPEGKKWRTGMPYEQFRSLVLPDAVEFDKALRGRSMEWEGISQTSESKLQKTRKRKKIPESDIVLVKNPKSPYPVYQNFLKADRFSMKELFASIDILNELDYQLKSSRIDPAFALERAIISICTPETKKHDAGNGFRLPRR